MKKCNQCGGNVLESGETYVGDIFNMCTCQNWKTLPYYIPNIPLNTLQPNPPCEHCFCKDVDVEGKPHIQCCMCSTRKLKFSKTY